MAEMNITRFFVQEEYASEWKEVLTAGSLNIESGRSCFHH